MKHFILSAIALAIYSIALILFVRNPSLAEAVGALVALSSLIVLIWKAEHAGPAQHDVRLYEEFQRVFPSNSSGMQFLLNHDTATSWSSEQTEEIKVFVARWGAADHDFINVTLQKYKMRLLSKAEELCEKMGCYSWYDGRYYRTRDTGEAVPRERVDELNRLGTEVAEAHKTFTRKAITMLSRPVETETTKTIMV